jgi:uncharacterized protein (UPF0276 family)
MKLACNYYLETEKLFDEGKIELDYFKYPAVGFHMDILKDLDVFEAFCDKLTSKRPVLLHGLYPPPYDLASPAFQADFNSESVNRLLKMTKTPGISLHAMLSRLPEGADFENIFSTVAANARFLKEKYGAMDFVALENFDHVDRYGDIVKPEFINRLLDESGCDFVLDISHAYYASRGLCVGFHDYLRKLPLEKVVEIHINGWIENKNGLMSHIKIYEEAYQALREVLQHCAPKIITVEYGRADDKISAGCPVISPDKINPDAEKEIAEQMNRIGEMIK